MCPEALAGGSLGAMTDRRPQIVRIVNITEDSFSDDGLHLAPQDALAHATDAAWVTAATVVKTDPEAVCVSIERFFTDRLSVLQAAGVGRERLIIDPGLGYFLGSNPHDAISAETSR
jgi:dihydropteroate synthase